MRKLAHHKGRYWWLEDHLVDRYGRVSLVRLTDSSSGKNVYNSEFREVVGMEYKKQIEAITYFYKASKDNGIKEKS